MSRNFNAHGDHAKPGEITPGGREQVEDLNDYLDLLEARARNKGKRTFSTEEVRREIGIVPGGRENSL
jgi:hypothetical protein